MSRLYPLILLGLIAGCGKPAAPTGTVTGSVTLDDKPFDGDVMVMLFDTSTGKGGTSEIADDGSYELPEPIPVGTYKVYVTPTPQPPPTDGSPPPALKIDKRIPDKYWNEMSTDLTVEVKEGPNEVPVPLKST